MNLIESKFEDYIQLGWNCISFDQYGSWERRAGMFLRTALDDKTSDYFLSFGENINSYEWEASRDFQISYLEGLLAKSQAERAEISLETTHNKALISPKISNLNNKVFLVHGHDEAAKESTARYLEKLGLEVIILHEKASEGKTIIEKFESHADVGFAVVLLTPDDSGSANSSPEEVRPRARQNVILELGYFTGKLGRSRVSGLAPPGVELPSDINGVVYIELDSQGGWKAKLAQELVTAKMEIKLEGLLQG